MTKIDQEQFCGDNCRRTCAAAQAMNCVARDQEQIGDIFGQTGYTRGSRIGVPHGTCAVEDIRQSDLIETLDDGPQPVRMVLRQSVQGSGDFAPVRFEAGTVGNSVSILVSPEQRILITDWRAQLLMGCDEILVAAKHLVNGRDVRRVECGVIDYFQLVLDRPQIVFGDGCPTESCVIDTDHAKLAGLRGDMPNSFSIANLRKSSLFASRMVVEGEEAPCLMVA
ncbi:Hint domain-containing protein [Sulfitobacter sp. F26169L]|uniref:Hint domain-containing protein n=1 Tax=Sulfitobacter sp. F26169L TaxID=2996015 RepID=UPI002260D1B4|nr:Hint domain-containing protein [Sulfitobacter sp. F26169L]MCX7565988.1 Hint domain-containing protein [Sulfitobacter sp. F26169L]